MSPRDLAARLCVANEARDAVQERERERVQPLSVRARRAGKRLHERLRHERLLAVHREQPLEHVEQLREQGLFARQRLERRVDSGREPVVHHHHEQVGLVARVHEHRPRRDLRALRHRLGRRVVVPELGEERPRGVPDPPAGVELLLGAPAAPGRLRAAVGADATGAGAAGARGAADRFRRFVAPGMTLLIDGELCCRGCLPVKRRSP